MTTLPVTSPTAVPAAPARPAAPPAPPGPVLTLRRTVRSELVKLRTLRTHVWLLLVAALSTLTLGPIQSIGVVVARGPDDAPAGGGVGSGADAVALALTGVAMSALLVGVLGVLVVTGEYAPRAVRTTFMLVPRRGHVVVGRLVALSLAVVAASVPVVVAAGTAGFAILGRGGIDAGWGDPQVPRIAVGMVWYLVGWAVLGQAFGWLTRSKIGGAAALFGVMVLLAPTLGLIPGPVGETLAALMPSSAGGAMISTQHATTLGSPAVGFLIWTGYLVLFTALSVFVVRRRDA